MIEVMSLFQSNYDVLLDTDVFIAGEYTLRLGQNDSYRHLI